jgi:hypothetical protein
MQTRAAMMPHSFTTPHPEEPCTVSSRAKCLCVIT